MKIFKYILAVLFFGVCACEKTVTTIDLEKKEAKLVLHGFISNEGDIITNLTVSKSSLTYDNIIYIKKGFIDIYDGETLVHSLEHDTSGFFFSKENSLDTSKEYVIKASAPNYPDVNCKFVIPSKVEISSIDTTVRIYTETWEWGESEERKDYTFHVKFDDDPQEENFYIIRSYRNYLMYKYDEVTYEPIDSFFDKQYIYMQSDDISAELGIHDNWIETKYEEGVYGSRGICFSDDFFSGKTKTFSFDVSSYEFYMGENDEAALYVELLTISKDYYTFLKSYALYEDSEYDPLAQKVNVYNNVEGGFGIIGTYSQTLDSIIIR